MRLNNYRYTVAVLALALLSADWVFAQEAENTDSVVVTDTIESKFEVSGQIEQSVADRKNFDLDGDSEDRILTLEPTLEFDLEYKASKNTSGSIGFQLGRESEVEKDEEGRTQRYTSTIEIDKAYFRFKRIFDVDGIVRKSSLKVGRFGLSDNREWLYDKSLDGILLSFELEPIATEFSLSFNREEWFKSDLLGDERRDPVDNFIIVAEHEPIKDVDLKVSAYTIVRNDRTDNKESPQFYGLTARGELADERLAFWTDFGWARGKDGDEKINGRGLDLRTTILVDKDRGPYITLGYAFGSGDGDDDTDFRQTDLQGNSDKFGGVAKFKYYGEVLDPELSNIHIYTAGIGFRFSSTASVDVVFHRYRQDAALDKLRGDDLNANPIGEYKEIGKELDIVMGFNLSKRVETQFVLGYFEPGPAFEDDSKAATLIEAKISYNF